MTDPAPPSQARLSRRGRARLKREQPVALTLIAEREQEAVDPPFDPPDENDLLGEHESERDGEAELILTREAELEAPLELDAPVNDTEALRAFAPSAMRAAEPVEETPPDAERRGQYQPPSNSALKYTPRKDEINESPVPPISIYASWDRPEIAEQQLQPFAADKHLARADIMIEPGGLDGAIAQCRRQSPDLLIIDTTLGAEALLSGLNRLARVIAPATRLIIIGAVNDVSLLRELAARGVAEYIVPPARRTDLVRAACRLFADASAARVIAVVGARGGVGASTLAQNLAWSLAERQWVHTALIDLDLPFGSAAFALGDNAITQPEPLEQTDFLSARATRAERLEIIAARTGLSGELRCDEAKLDAVLQAARRRNTFVVLDVPHDWNAWVKRALANADETLIVAPPDLASLRNTEGMLRQLKAAKARATPHVVLSMLGMRQRCEIPRKDFLNALSADAVLELAFEPELFGAAALKGLTLAEVAPRAKATSDIEVLATALSGRAPAKRKPEPRKAPDVPAPEALAPPSAEPEAIRRPAKQAKAKTERKQKKARPATAPAGAPDLITYPLTFLKPNEAVCTAAPMVDVAPADIELVAALRTRALAGAATPTRRALRLAALTALLLQTSIWTWQAQQNTASAAEPVHAAAAPARPAAVTVDPNATLRRDAEAGSAIAQFELAQRLRAGDGVAPDPAAALAWMERAAAGGHCQAMYELGVAYAQGDGAPRDDATAFRWFRQAAEFDVADAQYNLALLYQQGVGVSASMQEALLWFLRAARNGDGPAAERASMLSSFLPPAELEQARARMQAFQPQSTALPVRCATPPNAPSGPFGAN